MMMMMVQPSESSDSDLVWDSIKDIHQATCLDVTKGHIILAGKRALALVSANNPAHELARLSRGSKWDVSSVRFSSGNDKRLVALASGQHLEIYSVSQTGIAQEDSVKAHARSLTDLDWAPFQNSLLATCSVDDSIHLWDLKDLRRPVISIPVVAGANQVKWCKLLDCILATAHDGDIKIWDIRKLGTKAPLPIQNVAAHLSKVLGLDWSHTEDSTLVTTSQDSSLKRNTTDDMVVFQPMGNSLVTIPLPQVGRPDPNITLWKADGCLSHAQSLEGHSDVVLDICWSDMAADHLGVMKLFSLSKTHSLRLWNIGPDILESGRRLHPLGMNNYEALVDGLEETNVSDRLGTFAVEANVQDTSLAEFDNLPDLNLPSLTLEEVDKENGTVVVSFERKELVVKLEISFPIAKRTKLSFQFLRDTTLSNLGKRDLLKQLKEAFEEPGWNEEEPLLSASLKKLHGIVEDLSDVESERLSYESAGSSLVQSSLRQISSPVVYMHMHYLDHYVPFPRTTGAKFSSAGVLVYFGRVEIAEVGSGQYIPSPRSMAALAKNFDSRYPQSPKHPEFSVKAFYQKSLKSTSSLLSADKEPAPTNYSDVFVYDISALLPISKELAKKYSLSGDVGAICAQNSSAAASVGRQDLVQMWTLLEQTLSPSLKHKLNPDLETPWSVHPFGRHLINSYLDYFGSIGDVQSAALISCVLGSKSRFQLQTRSYLRTSSSSSTSSGQGSGTSPYNTIHTSHRPESLSSDNFLALVNRQRSSSFDEQEQNGSVLSLMDLVPPGQSLKSQNSEQNKHDRQARLLNTELSSRLEGVKQAYADALYRWGMLGESTQVLKYSTLCPTVHSGPAYITLCQNCGSDCQSAQCLECKNLAFQCSICQLAVRGLSCVCPLCGHGGHACHMSDWFEKYSFCPAGCGCSCIVHS